MTTFISLSHEPPPSTIVKARCRLTETAPAAGVNFPAGQVTHAAPSSPDEPALQVQFVNSALPAGENEFVGQDSHADAADAPTAAR